MYDIIIRNVRIIDGTGSPWYRGAVAIEKGKIAQVGNLDGETGKVEVDGEDKYLSPGFIDIHTHSDRTILAYPLAESRILQGVTTEMGSNCGISPFPVVENHKDDLKSYVGGTMPDYTWTSMASYLKRLEDRKISTNLGCLVGHGSLRLAVMGFSSAKANPEQLEQIKSLAVEALRDGAFGISSGLIYPPGSYSDMEEMEYVLGAVREEGGYYATHMRNERAKLVEAVAEALEVAKAAGVPLQISHHKELHQPLHGIAVKETTKMIEEARAAGQDVCCDQYPYQASATFLSSDIPAWGLEGGIAGLTARVADPNLRKKLEEEAEEHHKGRWHNLVISSAGLEKNQWLIGKSIEEIAQKTGKTPAAQVLDLVVEEGSGINEIDFGMSEEDIEFIMKKSYVMPGSDGEAFSLDCPGQPHPRNYGTFPRIIAHYCRDRKLFSLEEAIRKMTSMPAGRLRLSDRGVIKKGMWADLVIFDLEKLASTPTYQEPKKPCEGILQVYVNGVLTAENGVHLGARAGQVLRSR